MNSNLKLVTDDHQEAVDLYAQFYPQHIPTIFQQEMIESAVTDIKIWREALIYWAGNDYRPQSIQKLVDYYSQLESKAPKTRNAIRSAVGRPGPQQAIRCTTCLDAGEVERKPDVPKFAWHVEYVPCPECK